MSDTKSLSLYHLSSELTDLVSLRMEMVEAGEDTAEIDQQLTAYFKALPDKVDAVAHVIRHMDYAEKLATDEIQRLNARRRSFASERERLESYVKDVLAALPDPKRGKVKKIEGATSSLQLWPNGGLAPLDIQDPEMVPDEYCEATIKMDYALWLQAVTLLRDRWSLIDGLVDVKREPDNDAIRKALEQPCWDCSGAGMVPDANGTQRATNEGHIPPITCPSCGGSGKQGVPGCQLLPRGQNLRIR